MQVRPSELIRILNGEYIRLPANLGARVYDNGGGFTHDNSGNWDTVDTYDSERWDLGVNPSYTNGFWDVANPERLTAVTSGFYHVYFHATWESGASAATRLGALIVYYDGSTAHNVASQLAGGFAYAAHSVNTVIWMEAGQYVYSQLFQDSGGNLSLVAAQDWNVCEFGIQRIP